MPGPGEIRGPRFGFDRRQDRRSPIGRRNPGRYAFAGLDGLAKRRAHASRVVCDLRPQIELITDFSVERQANQPAGLFAHEIDGVGRDGLSRHHQIAFVLATRVVDQDDHPTYADVLDRLFDCGKHHSCKGRLRSPAPYCRTVRCARRA